MLKFFFDLFCFPFWILGQLFRVMPGLLERFGKLLLKFLFIAMLATISTVFIGSVLELNEPAAGLKVFVGSLIGWPIFLMMFPGLRKFLTTKI